MNRIIFLLGKTEIRFRTELWKVPNDEIGRFVGEPWDYKISGLKYPILVHAESWKDGIGCGLYSFDLEFYYLFHSANEDIIGRIIIRNKSEREFNSIKAKIANRLLKEFNVLKNRVEFGFIQTEMADIEYWYFPSR